MEDVEFEANLSSMRPYLFLLIFNFKDRVSCSPD